MNPRFQLLDCLKFFLRSEGLPYSRCKGRKKSEDDLPVTKEAVTRCDAGFKGALLGGWKHQFKISENSEGISGPNWVWVP